LPELNYRFSRKSLSGSDSLTTQFPYLKLF
jgi:hypothetical protein